MKIEIFLFRLPLGFKMSSPFYFHFHLDIAFLIVHSFNVQVNNFDVHSKSRLNILAIYTSSDKYVFSINRDKHIFQKRSKSGQFLVN